jgi:hypothetical protein
VLSSGWFLRTLKDLFKSSMNDATVNARYNHALRMQ